MCVFFFNNRCRAASRNPLNASQTVGSVCDRELNSTDSDHSSVIAVRTTGEQGFFFFSYSLLLLWKMSACKMKKKTPVFPIYSCYFLLAACEPEELLVPALPETAHVERGYITSQQVYNLLNAEDGQPALFDPYYILILDCRSAERWVHSNNSCLSDFKKTSPCPDVFGVLGNEHLH